jgi:predicted MFS family arabinose efflux permease
VAGPLVVAGCVAAASPEAALATAAALGLVGTLLLATSAQSRRWRSDHRGGDLLGALRSRGVVVVVCGLAGAGGSIGGLSVLAVAYAEDHPLPGGAGTLMAAYALGGFCGGVLHGRRAHRSPARRLLLQLAWLLAAACVPLVVVPASGAAMAALCGLAGLGLAPLLAVAFGVVDDVAAPGTITEAFAWVVALFQTGAALGATVIGAALDGLPLRGAAALLPLLAVAGAAVLTAGRRRLGSGP